MSDITATSAGFTQEAFDNLVAVRDEPNWVRQRRMDAWQAFLAMPMPSRSEEEWMRTDVRSLKLHRYALPTGEIQGAAPVALLAENVDLAGNSLTCNGTARSAQLDSAWSDKGVLFGNLAELLLDHEDLLRPYLFAKNRTTWPDRFAALHTACWTAGTLLYVPRGVVIDRPLHAQNVINDGGVDLTHTLVILEEGAEATF